MTTADIKNSLSLVAKNLANIRRLTKSAKKFYSQRLGSPKSYKHYQTMDSLKMPMLLGTVKSIPKKASCSSIETCSRLHNDVLTSNEATHQQQSTDLCEILDHITTQYNEQIGSLVGNIEKLSKRLVKLDEQNKFLKKRVISNQKSNSRVKQDILRTPILTEETEKSSPKTPVTLKQHTSSMLLFKRVAPRESSLRKIRAAPQVNSQFEKFKGRVSQLHQPSSNCLCKYC